MLLKINKKTVQFDSLLITQEAIYLFEVKNFEGDFYYESDRLYTLSKLEVMNPLHQLSSGESLLRQLLNSLGYRIPIEAFVVFINSEFTLYRSPLKKPFIFSTQFHRFMQKLDAILSKLNKRHKMLADKLLSLHLDESPYNQLPPFHYDQLKKELTVLHVDHFPL